MRVESCQILLELSNKSSEQEPNAPDVLGHADVDLGGERVARRTLNRAADLARQREVATA